MQTAQHQCVGSGAVLDDESSSDIRGGDLAANNLHFYQSVTVNQPVCKFFICLRSLFFLILFF